MTACMKAKITLLTLALGAMPFAGVGSCTLHPGGTVGITFDQYDYYDDYGVDVWIDDGWCWGDCYDPYYYDEYYIVEDYWYDWW